MARLIRTTNAAFTYRNLSDPNYKVTRRLSSVATNATDEDIMATAQAFATLNDGDVLSEILLTQQIVLDNN